ncbi:unnamed protein product [Ilex paraguariensis]|uniref:RBR-type E3 ubiquitin transferase n=1 Tax=Ilex paraguariensis TaxID=185542 RepID=A0ABC8RE15_9AQUA
MADPKDDEDLHTIATQQRLELMAAKTLESDLDFAFNLQLQEALDASLSIQPSSTNSPPQQLVHTPPESPDFLSFADYQSEELEKFELEVSDRRISEAEFKRLRDDLHRRIHDQEVAHEIHRMSDDEWLEVGDNFERPFGEGSSNSVNSEIFRIYFKGLVSEEIVNTSSWKAVLAGIGVAICDSRDEVFFELRKPLIGNGISRQCAELKALLEGLNAAIALDLKRVVFYCDYHPIYMFVTGRWSARQRKVATLANQVSILRNKFTYCNPHFVARNDIKLAFKLAREAIVSQINGPAESSHPRSVYENCVICLEDTDVGKMFSIDGCLHRYCFSCMKQHVEVKLHHGMEPKCPHEGCTSELSIDSCRKFLTPKLIEIMMQQIKEASIPVTEKVYCPYPKCSVLMSKHEVLEYSKGVFVAPERSGARKCLKCQGHFCINCKVPWHSNMTCNDYKCNNPNPPEDVKLKTLAANNLWRQCVKCNHMIELATGCFHMTCRCGYEFCYTCGDEWKNKKATCSCPLWHENNIIFDRDDEDEDDDDFDEEDEGEEYHDSEDDYYY